MAEPAALPRPTPDKLTICLCLTHARVPDFSLMAAAVGFQSIYVDWQHTQTSMDTTSMLCIAAAGAGIMPLVRVPNQNPEYMSRALDGGARGVIVPHVESAANAREVVNVCRFPPVGDRGVVGPNPVNYYKPVSIPDAVAYCETQTFVAVMLESANAVAQADEIAAVEGVDMILIGAFDLTTDMGIIGDFRHQKFQDAVTTISAACRKHGKVFGLAGVSDVTLLGEFVEAGVRFISGGTDAGLFLGAAAARATALNALSEKMGN